MKAHSLRPLALALPALLVTAALGAQAVPVDFEVGYRWVDVSGNEQSYRSQVNDRQGLLLRSLLYNSGPLQGLDFLKITASDIGAGPAGALRMSAGRSGLFRIDFSWRHQDLYSALSGFANPFVDSGIVPGQHTYSRTRDIYDANVDLLPGAIVSPILGYTRNVYKGPGRTTYTLGGDEFALNDRVVATDQEFRIGLAVHGGPIEGGVTQGWRQYRETDTATLAPGAGGGNSSGTVLGQPVTATGLTRTTKTSVNTPATSAWVSGRFEKLRLTGSYMHASPDLTGSSTEADAGSFVSFQIQRFFAGLVDTITPKVDASAWRGQVRAEISLFPGVDLLGGWAERHTSQTGLDTISSLYQNTVTYAGQGTGDIQKLLQTTNRLDRTDILYDASVSARLWAPLAVNVGWRQTQQSVTLKEDAAEIVIAGGQAGTYKRTVDTIGGGAAFTIPSLTLTIDYRRDSADQPIFRTDFLTRNLLRARAVYTLTDVLRFGGTWAETTANDDQAGIGYRTKVRELAGDLEVTLVPKVLTARGSAGEFRADRQILERAPQDFTISVAKSADFGHTWEGGLGLTVSRVALDAGYTYLKNNGTIPYVLKRAHARGTVGLIKELGLALEWWKDLYKEGTGPGLAGSLSNYNANRYYAGLYWNP